MTAKTERPRTCTFRGINALQTYGVGPLTGEACAFSHRILFDVTEGGKELLEQYLSTTLQLNDNWNSSVLGAPAIGSIMLSRKVAEDLLWFVLLAVERFPFIYYAQDGALMGTEIPPDDNKVQGMLIQGWQVHRNPSVNAASDRNTHAMSGRTF